VFLLILQYSILLKFLFFEHIAIYSPQLQQFFVGSLGVQQQIPVSEVLNIVATIMQKPGELIVTQKNYSQLLTLFQHTTHSMRA